MIFAPLLASVCLAAHPQTPRVMASQAHPATPTHLYTGTVERRTTTTTDSTANEPDRAERRARAHAEAQRWLAMRIEQGREEIQASGPGKLTPVQPADAFDEAIAGSWQVTAPPLLKVHDGYGQLVPPPIPKDLGWIAIQLDGHFEWDVPGETSVQGRLTEVVGSEASPDEHFWAFEGHGHTLVITPGPNGTLVLYDAGSNRYFAVAKQ